MIEEFNQEAKKDILEYWESRKKIRDAVDQKIVSWVDKINQLHWCCTLQSCAGHLIDGQYHQPGHIWLWLSEDTKCKFEENTQKLLAMPGIDYVHKYFFEHRNVYAVGFMGMNISPKQFEESVENLTNFLMSI